MIIGVVLAAGKGNRMNQQIKKQYMEINQKPLLYYSLLAFEKSSVDQIILVTGEGDVEFCQKEIVEKYDLKKVGKVIPGGKERFLSVMEALKYINAEDVVLIHDGARPCVTKDLIQIVIDCTQKNGNCIAVVKVSETIKQINLDGTVKQTIAREQLVTVQTPQGFIGKELIQAYHDLEEDLNAGGNIFPTDDGMVYELYGKGSLYTVEGDYQNRKVTTIEDVFFVENHLK